MIESIHNVSTELIVAALSMITAAGGGLSFAVGKLWTWVDKRIQDCEADRTVLHSHIDGMNTELRTLSRTVGQMEGTLSKITSRNEQSSPSDLRPSEIHRHPAHGGVCDVSVCDGI